MKPLLPSDTIVCDTAQLKNYINCGKYNYDSELGDEAPSLFEKIQDAIGDWINDFFKDIFGVKDTVFSAHSDMRYVWIALAVIVLLVIAYFIYKKKMFFFSKKTKVEDDYQIVEDTIYGIDFDADIATALTSGNYKEAVSDGEADEWTILMDEPDRNLSIDNIKEIQGILSYRKPQTQLIAIVHNPLIIYTLSKKKGINIIEMSEGYVDKVVKTVKDIIK